MCSFLPICLNHCFSSQPHRRHRNPSTAAELNTRLVKLPKNLSYSGSEEEDPHLGVVTSITAGDGNVNDKRVSRLPAVRKKASVLLKRSPSTSRKLTIDEKTAVTPVDEKPADPGVVIEEVVPDNN